MAVQKISPPPPSACFQECEFAFEMILSSLYHGGQLNAAASTTYHCTAQCGTATTTNTSTSTIDSTSATPLKYCSSRRIL